jgi:hypothetical protein
MPFRSAKQRRFMYAVHPDIAKRWAEEFGNKVVPAKKSAKKEKKRG